MALTSADETDLLIPLHDAARGPARFAAFLAMLRQRTRAARTEITIQLAGAGRQVFHDGLDIVAEARRRGLDTGPVEHRLPLESLRPMRVYAAAEFLDDAQARRDAWEAHLGSIGLVDERVVRMLPADGVEGWLSVSRGEPCTASDSALLSALAPHVGVALRVHAAMIQADLAQAMAGLGLARAGTGWIAFDGEARVLDADPLTAQWLERTTGHALRPGERLLGLPAMTERRMAGAIVRIAANRAGPGEAVCLWPNPRIDMVLERGKEAAGAGPVPAVVGLCRLPAEPSLVQAERLAELHGIGRREAELAVLVSNGHSIAEAARAMGLTEETARNYSKQLYAKLGVRGQAGLVRLVCDSGAVLA